MRKRMAWIILSCLMALSLVLASCGPAAVEEEEEVVPEEEEKEVVVEEEEAVVEEEGPVMVRDVKGRLVEKPQYGGTVTIVRGSDPTYWDPWMETEGGGYITMGSIYEMLTGGDWSVDRSDNPFTSNWVPLKYGRGYSAESWENPDPLTYVIHLRKGMRFHNKPPVNGREVTAADVKYSIDRILGLGEFAEDGPTPRVGMPPWACLEEVEVVDKYTFILHLKEESPLFPEYWGTEYMPWIHPREVVDTYGKNFSWDQAVGHGPWQLADAVIGSSVTFDKHPNYYGWDENFPDNQIPYADTLKTLIIPDASTVLAALRTGKIDSLPVGWEDAGSLQQTNPELKWNKVTSVCSVLEIRNSLEPYTDIRVRKAMQMAINLPELAEEYYGGTAEPYPMMVQPSLVWLHTLLEELPQECQEAFTYNPERARELLAEAGYPNGFKQTWPMSGASDLGDLFIAYWEAIGIETEIDLMEGAVFYSFIYSGKHQMVWLYSCGDWMPTEILNYWYGGQAKVAWNLGDVNDPVFNKYLDDIRAEPDAAERDRLMKEAFAHGTCQFFYIAGPQTISYVFWQPWLKGYQGERRLTAWSISAILARVWIDQDLKYEMTGKRD